MSSARMESDESNASRFLSKARSRLALKPLTTTLSTGAAIPPPTVWGTCSTARRIKGRRTISPLEPSDTTSRSVPRVSRETACWASMSPEMAGARRPSTDSGVNRMLSPVFWATLRSASDIGCSWMESLVSWAAAAALMDRTATLPNRTERNAPQRDIFMVLPLIRPLNGPLLEKRRSGDAVSPPPFTGRNRPSASRYRRSAGR
jgi:hypothetical protein